MFAGNDADWCNGSTADSDSVSRGSNPLSVVPWQGRRVSWRTRHPDIITYHRSVAQLGRALRSGRRGRVFESRHSDFYPHFMGVFHFLGVEKVGWLWLGLSSVCQILKFGISLLDNLFLFGKV